MGGNDDKQTPSLKPLPNTQLTYDHLQNLVKTYKLSNQYAFDHLPLKKRILLDLAERKYHHTYTSSESDSGESEASIESEKENTNKTLPLQLPNGNNKQEFDETMSSSSGTSSINNFSPPSQSTPTIIQAEKVSKFATPEIRPHKIKYKPLHTSPLLSSPISSNDSQPDKIKKKEKKKTHSSNNDSLFLIPQRPVKERFRQNEYLKSRLSPIVPKHEKKTKKKRKSSDDADKLARKQARSEKKEQKKRAAKDQTKIANSVTGVEHIVETNSGLAYHIDKDDPSNESITCFCLKPFAGRMMIECDFCQIWYHVDCVGLNEKHLPDEYYCERSKDCVDAKKHHFGNTLKL